VVDRDGRRTGLHAVCNCPALLPVAVLPTVVGLAGSTYFLAALVLGLVFLWSAVGLARGGGSPDARRLLFVSLVYLPVVLAVMALDKLS
jgi:protoheme IX farnesyltransferase